MIIKKFKVDFYSKDGALTLNPLEVSEKGHTKNGDIQQKTHPDGWTIKGEVHEDFYEWVNDFEATHPTYGKVWGNFESEVYADSEEGYNHFYENHTPEAWDYEDI
jgi:hypothetical protein